VWRYAAKAAGRDRDLQAHADFLDVVCLVASLVHSALAAPACGRRFGTAMGFGTRRRLICTTAPSGRREVSGWTGPEIAAALDCSVAAVDSALQRVRASLQRHTPDDRHDWSAQPSTALEDRLLGCYIAAHEAADVDALARLLADTARFTMPPRAVCFEGRDAVVAEFRLGWGRDRAGDWRLVPARANRQPAAAAYLRAWWTFAGLFRFGA